MDAPVIIWDWNGTLLDDTRASLNALNTLLTTRRLKPITMDFYRDHFAFPVRPFYETCGIDLAHEDWDALARDYHDLYANEAKRLNAQTLDALDDVRAHGVEQCVLSILRQDLLDEALASFHIRDYFSRVCGTQSLDGASKLDQATKLKSLLGDTRRIVMIGDALHDAEVARALRVPCVLCAQGGHSATRLRAAAPCGETLLEAVALALKILRSPVKPPTTATRNLYVHFPFCRSKCSYCALYSRAGATADEREAYVRERCQELDGLGPFSTVYFGGGTPTLCDLKPLFNVLNLAKDAEFTVELHPLDATDRTLATLRDGGVTRISMGVESLDDATLVRMGRGYTVREAEASFQRVKRIFPHAGIDLIVGYPHDPCENFGCLASWGLSHISVYALQNERGLQGVPSDDIVLDRLARTADFLATLGLERYEISNYALKGEECRHNLAVWRGEDYIGLGEGACGREGLTRTRGRRGRPEEGRRVVYDRETLSPERDDIERRIFRLRTREGLDSSGHPAWEEALRPSLDDGLLTRAGNVYRLTPRGLEVCDAILSNLVLA